MTDEYRQQMQNGDKVSIQAAPIVVQQLSNNIDPAKVYNQLDVS